MRFGVTLVLSMTIGLAVSFPAAAAEATSVVLSEKKGESPLVELLTIAEQREKVIRETVRDYTCLLVKRERIHGKLQEHRFIEIKVRAASERNGDKTPMAVRMQFLRPQEAKGRLILFVDGQNEGQMVVRRGGARLSNMVMDVDPDSDLAKTETSMQITHLGLDGMVAEIMEHVRQDIKADPTGANTELKVVRDAKINDRKCTFVEITHPKRAEGLLYFRARFFMDNEYHLPARVEAYDWPKKAGAEPELLGEFTYTKVKINVGLTDADFDAQQLRTAAR